MPTVERNRWTVKKRNVLVKNRRVHCIRNLHGRIRHVQAYDNQYHIDTASQAVQNYYREQDVSEATTAGHLVRAGR